MHYFVYYVYYLNFLNYSVNTLSKCNVKFILSKIEYLNTKNNYGAKFKREYCMWRVRRNITVKASHPHTLTHTHTYKYTMV